MINKTKTRVNGDFKLPNVWQTFSVEPIENVLSRCPTHLNKLLVSSLAKCKYFAPVLSWLSFTAVRDSSGMAVTWMNKKHASS